MKQTVRDMANTYPTEESDFGGECMYRRRVAYVPLFASACTFGSAHGPPDGSWDGGGQNPTRPMTNTEHGSRECLTQDIDITGIREDFSVQNLQSQSTAIG